MSLSSCSSRRLSSSKICVEDSLPLMEVPPTANPLALHKVTLRFEDREVEREVCSKYTHSTYVMNMSVVGFLFVQHIVISIWKPALMGVGAIYIPICGYFLVARWFIHHRRDRHGEYNRNQWVWLSAILICTSLQRASFALGLHPFLTIEESTIATLYIVQWGMVAVMLHLQLVSFELRVTMLVAIWLSLATVNWGDDRGGWTYHGQPADTVNITSALIMGEMVGYFAERLIRDQFAKHYAERHQLQAQLNEDEALLDEIAAGIFAKQQVGRPRSPYRGLADAAAGAQPRDS